MIKNTLITVLLINLCISNSFAGGPWTIAKNKSYAQIGYNIISENNRLFSTQEDDLFLYRAITDQTINFYSEYGITERFSITLQVPYKLTSNSDKIYLPNDPYTSVKGHLNSFGNLSFSSKYQIYKKKFAIALRLDFLFPTATQDLKTRLSTGYDSYGILPGISIGLSNNKWYGYAQLGYHYRTSLTNEIHFNIEAGHKIYKEIYGIIAIDILQSTQQLKERDDTFLYLYQDQQQYYASTLKISSKIWKNIGLNLHMTIITINANYVQKGPALGGSIYCKF